MHKILISMPEQLVLRMKTVIPQKQRSKVIACLIEEEIEKRERSLYECAMQVEKDKELEKEMQDWDVTLNDGLTDETW